MGESTERRIFLPAFVLATAVLPAIWFSHSGQEPSEPAGPRYVNVASFTQEELRGFDGKPGGEVGFTIQVNKTKGTRVGLKFREAEEEGGSLKVEEVLEDGLVAEWNRRNPGKRVLAGDSLVEVNGEADAGKIVEECAQNKALDLTVSRTKDKTILIAIWGRVFNVSSGTIFYGAGQGYRMFAGRECTYNMAVTSVKKKSLARDLEGVTDKQFEHLNETYWETYVDKYPIVGVLKDSPFDPSKFDHFAGSWEEACAPRLAEVQEAANAKNFTVKESRCPVTRVAKNIGKTLAQFVPRMLLGQ